MKIITKKIKKNRNFHDKRAGAFNFLTAMKIKSVCDNLLIVQSTAYTASLFEAVYVVLFCIYLNHFYHFTYLITLRFFKINTDMPANIPPSIIAAKPVLLFSLSSTPVFGTCDALTSPKGFDTAFAIIVFERM